MKQDHAFLATKARNENARRAIRQAILTPEEIQRTFGLSPTAFVQLAGQVRSGFVA
jgi:hypothetical protein